MDSFYVQLTSLFILLAGNFIVGTLPYILLQIFFRNDHDECRKNRVLTYLIYFGGGVFMSTCFLSLQPKAHVEYENHHHHQSNEKAPLCEEQETEHHEGFPIPEFVLLCSFFAMFVVEEILQIIFIGFRKKSLYKVKKVPFCSCAKRHTECSRTFKAANPAEQTLFGLEKNLIDSDKGSALPEYLENARTNEPEVNMESRLLQPTILTQPVPNYGAVTNATQMNTSQQIPILAPPMTFDEDGQVKTTTRLVCQIDYRPFSTHLLLAITIALYDICQGTYIGHLKSSLSWMHSVQWIQQFIISFVAGSTILQTTDSSLTVACYIGLLSIMCPLGISMKMIFSNALRDISHLTVSFTNAAICGSFLYLTFIDLLRGCRLSNASSIGKFLSFTTGSVVIAVLQYLSFLT